MRARLAGQSPTSFSLGRYVVRERLGQGGNGIVYRAEDPKLGRDVALKVVVATTPERTEAVLAEAHALAKLNHPNVVAVFDAGQCEGAVYIAMELVEGVTLAEWFAGGRRSGPETIRVLLDAGRGLAAAHAAGLVHRDFKPSNVMVGDDGRVRVLDFGLARSVLPQLLTVEGTTPAGTPGYMAPEQRQGQPPTAASDQYAFCVTFHEALTLRRPDDGRLARWWLSVGRPIIARGLRPNPSERHPSMLALIHRFERRRSLYLGAGLAGAAMLGAAVTGALLR